MAFATGNVALCNSDGVNHDAHFFGAVYGAMFTFAFEPARVERTMKSFF